jgi:hypothetical protein
MRFHRVASKPQAHRYAGMKNRSAAFAVETASRFPADNSEFLVRQCTPHNPESRADERSCRRDLREDAINKAGS